MPNNPGRIDGDYSTGDKESVKFVDPGNFGRIQAKKRYSNSRVFYLIIIIIALLIAFVLLG